MSIILDTRTQSTLKSVQYNGRQDPGGYVYIGITHELRMKYVGVHMVNVICALLWSDNDWFLPTSFWGLYLLSGRTPYNKISWSSTLRDSGLHFPSRFEISHVPQQQHCRDACQMLERYDQYNIHPS